MPLQLLALQLTNYHTLGRSHGQRLMRRMQTRLTQAINHLKRAEDWQCAWGDGHMVFCLPDTSARGAQQLARRLLRQLAEHRFHYQGASLRFEMRAGLHTLCLEGGKAPDYRKQIMRTLHIACHGAEPLNVSPQLQQALAAPPPAAAAAPSRQLRFLLQQLDEPARARLVDELLLASVRG
ncbi:diguanylate cyclase [Alcanivorax sp. CY1518]|uniref:Diguanylate cyclase n=2 Tax=Alcanivorax quisquiliarum TaxID=2933565 RepID=A0ABT0E460_9GAMM|nr:diguanylate cyclase [Alcanivorax quisquiliarum]